MAELLADVDLRKANGTSIKGNQALQGKVVALYFSAHWCPPCRQFTPVLKDFYEDVGDDEFDIVFVSFDRTEDDLKEYMAEAHGDWYYIPFGNKKIQELASKYGVEGIPALIIIKSNGDVITKNGRADVSGKSPKQALTSWKSA